MNHLLRMLAWYADTVLSICYPEPEAPHVEEEVRSGFKSVVLSPPDRSWVGFEDGFGRPVSSPVVAGHAPGETPGGSGHSPVPSAGHLDDAAEGLRSSAAPSVADSPGKVAPPTDPGRPNLTKDDCDFICFLLRTYAKDSGPSGREYAIDLVDKFADKLNPRK
jgi:hypothetical protein